MHGTPTTAKSRSQAEVFEETAMPANRKFRWRDNESLTALLPPKDHRKPDASSERVYVRKRPPDRDATRYTQTPVQNELRSFPARPLLPSAEGAVPSSTHARV